ncbi:hypothetical protein LOTGIDRAFT_231390 [Lottia gigantea]|uniref:Uncharacterized protein n=1 Tax=Lottia gigantea TaxID=225164 RepID=V4AXL3_LOTGI|nr:hypothetical protein LOTGIDRAFT_231390 [Lottia gigantea]ESO98316.1 hypothetical protein LOTGIDRAFT_231390 [Lottia gigantea]
MPRKRTAKVSKRNKPKCPEGDEGKSLTEEERHEKLAVFTKDFDIKYQEKIKRMALDQQTLLNAIERKLHCQIMQLPACIKKMKLKDFIELGGTIEAALAESESAPSMPSSLSISGKLAQSISKLNPKILPTCEVIQEEGEPTPVAQKRTVRKNSNKSTTGTGVRKSTRKRGTKGNESLMAPPSVSRIRMTPASRTMSTSGWPTPLITPKFDPRLPFTPGMNRDPKPGERILSLAGSPINNPQDGEKKSRTGKGRVRTLTVKNKVKEELENLVIPDSPTDIKNMRQSQMFKAINLLSNILKQSDDDEQF